MSNVTEEETRPMSDAELDIIDANVPRDPDSYTCSVGRRLIAEVRRLRDVSTAAVAAEREACARVAEESQTFALSVDSETPNERAASIADRIRARGAR